jgi:hypothetical protein
VKIEAGGEDMSIARENLREHQKGASERRKFRKTEDTSRIRITGREYEEVRK